MIGFIYFLVIVFSNTIGAISGMGGGVIIKPVLDFIGVHSAASISFYSTVAVFTMSIVSVLRHIKNGTKLNWRLIIWIACGAIIGGALGNVTFELLLSLFENDSVVTLIQIILIIITLIFALIYSKYNSISLYLSNYIWYIGCGIVLGFLSSLLGIGGGPINVSLLMLMFAMPIKEATIYSISIIFFSQLSKLITITFSTGYGIYDLSMLIFIIPAAIIGGIVGAKVSKILSAEKVTVVFQSVIILVLLINVYNGFKLF